MWRWIDAPKGLKSQGAHQCRIRARCRPEGRDSTLVTPQSDPSDWYKSRQIMVIAESILNRTVIAIEGPNMRRHPATTL